MKKKSHTSHYLDKERIAMKKLFKRSTLTHYNNNNNNKKTINIGRSLFAQLKTEQNKLIRLQ